MTRVYLIGLITLFFGAVSFGAGYITVNHKAVRIDRKTRCHGIAKHAPNTYFDCCIVKQKIVGKADSEGAVKNCLIKVGSTSESVSSMDRSEITQIYNKAIENLKPLNIYNMNEAAQINRINTQAPISEEQVLTFMDELNKKRAFSLPTALFANEQGASACFAVRALGDAAKGYNSGQLFAIKYNERCLDGFTKKEPNFKPLYILKETKKGFKEIRNLYQVKASTIGDEKVTTQELMRIRSRKNQQGMAKITFDDVHFSIGRGKEKRYFSFLQTAPGQSLHSILKGLGDTLKSDVCIDDKESAVEDVKHAFYRLGQGASLLHQKFAVHDSRKISGRTYIHGDFHAQNIFFDSESDQVTLIDNETFSMSLGHKDIGVQDISDLYLLHTVKTVAHQFTDQLLVNSEFGIENEMWHEFWFHLLDGYVGAYGMTSSSEKLALISELRKDFKKGLSGWRVLKSVKNFKDQRMLKRIGFSHRLHKVKTDDLDRIFERLVNKHVDPAEDLKNIR